MRTKGHGCPLCVSKSSRLEIRLLCELRRIFSDVKWRAKINGQECDLYVPEINCGIELDGRFWHLPRETQDTQKNKNLAASGLKVVRIREKGLPLIGHLDTFYEQKERPLNVVKRLLEVLKPFTTSSATLKAMKAYAVNSRYLNNGEYRKILAILPSPLPEDSLATKFPILAREWSERNLPLTPDMFRPNSHKKVWWICPKGHQNYQSTLAHRSNGRGCPECARLERIKATQRAAIRRSGSVADDAKLAPIWHPTRNYPLLPNELSRGSKVIVWWKCDVGHEWKLAVVEQTKRGICPDCTKMQNSLAAVWPDLAKEWHPTKNLPLTPEKISKCNQKKVWWRCAKGHEWEAVVANRSPGRKDGGTGCPHCARENH